MYFISKIRVMILMNIFLKLIIGLLIILAFNIKFYIKDIFSRKIHGDNSSKMDILLQVIITIGSVAIAILILKDL